MQENKTKLKRSKRAIKVSLKKVHNQYRGELALLELHFAALQGEANLFNQTIVRFAEQMAAMRKALAMLPAK